MGFDLESVWPQTVDPQIPMNAIQDTPVLSDPDPDLEPLIGEGDDDQQEDPNIRMIPVMHDTAARATSSSSSSAPGATNIPTGESSQPSTGSSATGAIVPATGQRSLCNRLSTICNIVESLVGAFT